MDPNEALRRMRDAIAMVFECDDDEDSMRSSATDLAEYASALDQWLSKRGSLPTVWER